jgi:tRNA pseudouridine55 synthase
MATTTLKKSRVALNGVLLLDKAAGWSSNDALMKAKRLFNAQKAGHTGTLDPFATGLLPLCFGEATKFSQDLLDADKTYRTVLHLGVATTTGDTEGEVIAREAVEVSASQVEEVLERFRGPIEQVPPMYSALKRNGKPLYEYARAGITLEREARRVTIRRLELVEFRPPYLELEVACTKGTYIRVLGEDIGIALGCGAHLDALRRTRAGDLLLDNAVTLDALATMGDVERLALLAPVDALLTSFDSLALPDDLADRFCHGQRLSLNSCGLALPKQPGRIRVYRLANGGLLGTGQLAEYGVLAPERLIAQSAA